MAGRQGSDFQELQDESGQCRSLPPDRRRLEVPEPEAGEGNRGRHLQLRRMAEGIKNEKKWGFGPILLLTSEGKSRIL